MIYYSVRVVLGSLPPIVPEGKLEALALIQSHQLKKQEAETLAQTAAEHHGFEFDVYKVEERQHGRYRPNNGSNINGVLRPN